MERYMKFAVAFCSLWTLVSCSQQHLVCKTVEDVCTEHVGNFTELVKLAKDRPLCEVKYGPYNRRKCFTIPHVSSSSDMNYNEAVAECAKTGALLAEIQDRTQQQALQDFAFSKMPSGRSYVDLWVGMKYQRSTSTLLYRSGKQTSRGQFQWDQGYPTSYGSGEYLMLEVGSGGGSPAGLMNARSSIRAHGVLCESKI